MLKRALLLLFILLFLAVTIQPQNTGTEASEFNIWTDTSVTYPLIRETDGAGKEFDRLSLTIFGTLRFGRKDRLRPVDERIGDGLNYRINNNFSLATDVFYRDSQPVAGRRGQETRIRFAAVLEKKWPGFSLNNRQQIEFRQRRSRRDDIRYKPRLRINIPITREKKEIITPFFSTEPYYNVSNEKWTRNEIFVGFGKKLCRRLGTDFYYLNVRDADQPRRVQGIGIAFKFRVD